MVLTLQLDHILGEEDIGRYRKIISIYGMNAAGNVFLLLFVIFDDDINYEVVIKNTLDHR